MVTDAAAAAGAVKQEKEGWLVRVRLAGGAVQEFRCANEGQARYFAAVLALNPPKPSKLRN
ncbi:hypothetical protein FGE12_13910 [Aggregicoccus sp. 17bor-14]|uniref:hypothetical protein n=1 Tax=Myxococcaceae TaxID=31 RepID=UPI00129C5795|nr:MULTISPECIES: hypothetical protein [Myxococcaceae]MBF5043488.1 hypothetical protein [Simulacricoccus sp. 17bor-14]MRI89246.1 hypothetical protein [Aggregicoccus sp. 17bor-14]